MVAQMVAANKTMATPKGKPKIAPAKRDNPAAPGKDRPETATYTKKNISAVFKG